ncbi:hypothetical protein [Candidatus Methylomirabilis sp.]|uniref:Uncharacterized protein n=1 Tax=Candidatus Methylomirabilis tolerans TaxID=3123416 RepID=A0AAJ1EIY6_9BACT|nr:hypothetical protein [Candidatus Methylomirabilis sp.]
MRRPRVIWISVVGLLLIAFAGSRILESAEPAHQLLTGQLWQTMSPDAKVAFVWGIGSLVEYERAQVGASSMGTKSFIPFLVKGLKGKSIDEVVRLIDTYYQAHPDQIQRPVLDVIFQAVVLPTLTVETEGGMAK